jgi:hypothetical protein
LSHGVSEFVKWYREFYNNNKGEEVWKV